MPALSERSRYLNVRAAGDVLRHGVDRRQLADADRFLVRDRRIAPLGTGVRIARIAALKAADRPAVDEERRRAGGRDVARERLVHAAHDRRQRDDDEHADGDAEDRERGASLVRLMASKAMLTPSSACDALWRRVSCLVSQRFDGIEQRCTARRVDAGHDADDGAEQRGHDDRPRRDRRGQAAYSSR